jgi:hypothetical protein
LLLDAVQAVRVQSWIAGAVYDPELPPQPMRGFAIVRGSDADEYRVAWQPALALSQDERERHGFDRSIFRFAWARCD